MYIYTHMFFTCTFLTDQVNNLYEKYSPVVSFDLRRQSGIFITYVTQSDKKGLIAGKYMSSLNNMYLKFSIRYYNSVTFIKLSINFYISGKVLNSYHVCTKSYKISNLEIMVKI